MPGTQQICVQERTGADIPSDVKKRHVLLQTASTPARGVAGAQGRLLGELAVLPASREAAPALLMSRAVCARVRARDGGRKHREDEKQRVGAALLSCL